jgi:hypothetical protein
MAMAGQQAHGALVIACLEGSEDARVLAENLLAALTLPSSCGPPVGQSTVRFQGIP